MFRVYKVTAQARNEGVFLERSSTSTECKRKSIVGSIVHLQGRAGGFIDNCGRKMRASVIAWEFRTSQMYV